MKKVTKFLAAALSLVTVIGAGSCNSGSGGRNPSGDGSSDPAATDATTTTTAATTLFAPVERETDEAVQSAAAELKIEFEEIDPSKMRKITFLVAWADSYDHTQAGLEVFKANYGIPEEDNTEKYGDNADKIVIPIKTSDGAMYDDLATLSLAGNPPDTCDFVIDQFPYTAIKKMFQPIDTVVDMSGPEWDGWREISEGIEWGGKHYCPVIESYTMYVWYYRKSLMEEYGFDDPYELALKGEWDWDKMMEYAEKFKSTSSGKGLIANGWKIPDDIHRSTGVPLVGIENGKLKSFIHDDAHMRAGELVEKMFKLGYINEDSKNEDIKKWIDGDSLFYENGLWKMQGDIERYAGKFFSDGNDDVWFVWPPKDPKADGYYGLHRIFGYAFVTGSDNVDSYKALVQSMLLGNTDPATKAVSKEKSMREEGWTEEQWDLNATMHDPALNLQKNVVDLRNGIDSTGTQTTTGQTMFDEIVFDPGFSGTITYGDAIEKYDNVINSAIEEMNETA